MPTNILNLSTLQIKEIQSLFNRLGYKTLSVDGIIGTRTEEAVRIFQRTNEIAIDGIIGPVTYKIINDFLNGYVHYTIKAGDTYYNIAKLYGIDYRLIEAANPNINPSNLIPGINIIVPLGISIIPIDMEYTYEIMLRNIRSLKILYPFITLVNYGTSTLGRGIYGMKVGIGSKQRFFNASHHGLEWLTTPLLMKYSEEYLNGYVLGKSIAGVSAQEIYNTTNTTIMPMVNPDGVTLVQQGLSRSNPNYENLIEWNGGSTDFSRTWQANNNGVDINHNYNAGWQEYKELAASLGYDTPGPSRYPGPAPNSEPETRAVINAVNSNNFELVVAYHTQGEVIYWQYQNLAGSNSKRIGEELARVSGYTLDNAEGLSSYSGFKDWFILKYRRPGYTVEVGRGVNPLPISDFDSIYKVNVPLIVKATTIEV